MSNPTQTDDANVLEQALTQAADLMGGMFDSQRSASVVGPDVGMGKLFLALTKNPDVPSHDRVEGAQAAYNSWYESIERRLMRGLRDGDAIPSADDIRQGMADELEAQLVELNNDRALSADASKKIKELMTGGPDAFAEAIEENGGPVDEAYASYVAAKKAYQETKKSDPNAKIAEPALDVVGILAVLQQPNSEGQTPTLNAVKTAHLDVSAEGQRDASLRGATESVIAFMNGGGGSEDYLRRLHQVSSSEDVTPIAGFGGLGPQDFQREFGAFLSDAGLSGVRGEGFRAHHDHYALTDMGQKLPANFENLITRAGFENTGIVKFGKDGATAEEVQAARDDFTQHMATYISEKKMNRERLDPDELQEHMKELALERSDITLNVETPDQAKQGKTAAEARAAQAFVANNVPVDPNDPAAQQATAWLNGVVDDHSSNETLVASVEVANAYPIAERVENPEAIAAEGDLSMGTVPVVMAGLNVGQTPMPAMGYGVQADGPAANSPNDPNMQVNLQA